MEKDIFKNLLVEKYRPKTLNDIVLSDKNRQYFEQIKTKQEIPHLMFYGEPGIGKTTLAKIVVNDILNCQYLYINASDESGVDAESAFRISVVVFSSTSFLSRQSSSILGRSSVRPILPYREYLGRYVAAKNGCLSGVMMMVRGQPPVPVMSWQADI